MSSWIMINQRINVLDGTVFIPYFLRYRFDGSFLGTWGDVHIEKEKKIMKPLLIFLGLIAFQAQATRDVVLILGYNNTRSGDVKRLRSIAQEELTAQTILCKPHPVAVDYEVADHVIDVSLKPESSSIETVLSFLKTNDLTPRAILPFSDVGTQLGAVLAERLGLPGHDPARIIAGLDKFAFRNMEKKEVFMPLGYRSIASNTITSLDELKEMHTALGGKLFLKPQCEGNSRGCTAVESLEDTTRAWDFVKPYQAGGIVTEELVEDAHEFSCDSVAGVSWLTQKKNSSGPYRWEIKYILPAPLDHLTTHQILEGGRFMAAVSGSRGGAYHNEIFFKPESREIIAVEPNLRPAGGRIWDAARLAFRDFDPWRLWLKSMAGIPQNPQLIRDYYVAFKMIAAPVNGILREIPEMMPLLDEEYGELIWRKKLETL